MEYDLNRPWLTLDKWQKKYIYDSNPNQDNFLLTGRQSGKTAAMSMRAVELCVNYFKKGQNVLICSITEKQAYRMLIKALVYAKELYHNEIKSGKDKPTMHKILFKNGTGIYCYAAGETGEGLRGDTIKKLFIDEGARMSEEFFISVTPMMSVAKGSMDIASTPFGKKNKDGSDKFFFKCSKDDKFKKYYISAEDCPRHSKEFLEQEKKRMPKLAYSQEYLALFLDELRQVFSNDLIKECCVLKRRKEFKQGNYFIGSDIAGFGKDESTFEIFDKISDEKIEQVENIIEKKNLTTDTSKKIIELNMIYKPIKIGIDDQGIGFGVYSELLDNDKTKRKVIALNNSARPINYDGEKFKRLLKEEMYMNMQVMMEKGKVKFLDDDEIKASLTSMQYDENGVIFGSYSHICEGIVRSLWLAKDKRLKCFIKTF